MNAPRPMTKQEQDAHADTVKVIRSCLSALRLTGLTDDDVAVAKARLDNWLTENDGRWTA